MSAISRSLANPQPLYTRVLYPTKRKYQIIRMKEILHNAMNGNRSGNMFAVPADTKTSYPGSATADGFCGSFCDCSLSGSDWRWNGAAWHEVVCQESIGRRRMNMALDYHLIIQRFLWESLIKVWRNKSLNWYPQTRSYSSRQHQHAPAVDAGEHSCI